MKEWVFSAICRCPTDEVGPLCSATGSTNRSGTVTPGARDDAGVTARQLPCNTWKLRLDPAGRFEPPFLPGLVLALASWPAGALLSCVGFGIVLLGAVAHVHDRPHDPWPCTASGWTRPHRPCRSAGFGLCASRNQVSVALALPALTKMCTIQPCNCATTGRGWNLGWRLAETNTSKCVWLASWSGPSGVRSLAQSWLPYSHSHDLIRIGTSLLRAAYVNAQVRRAAELPPSTHMHFSCSCARPHSHTYVLLLRR